MKIKFLAFEESLSKLTIWLLNVPFPLNLLLNELNFFIPLKILEQQQSRNLSRMNYGRFSLDFIRKYYSKVHTHVDEKLLSMESGKALVSTEMLNLLKISSFEILGNILLADQKPLFLRMPLFLLQMNVLRLLRTFLHF